MDCAPRSEFRMTPKRYEQFWYSPRRLGRIVLHWRSNLFEIPSGIEQIQSLKTETHLFLFDTLPPNPWDALQLATNAHTV